MLPSWASDSITIKRPSTTESRGSTLFDYDNTTDTTVTGCSVQPAETSIDRDGRVLAVTSGMTAYLPPGTDVQAGDMIAFDGDNYLIEGDIRTWNSPTGLTSNIILNLKRYSG